MTERLWTSQQNRPCPACGGTDRFYYIAAPNDESDPYWRCRQCDFTERDDGDAEESESHGEATVKRRTPEETAESRYAYGAVARYCAEQLWTPAGAKALAYLRERGLSDTTIHDAMLGWSGDALTMFSKLWRSDSTAYEGALTGGLRKNQGVPKPVLQKSITIPYWVDGVCVLLRSRLLEVRPGLPKYLSPSGPHYAGGEPWFYLQSVLKDADRVILTEGELKALAAHQEWQDGNSPIPCIATPGALMLTDGLIPHLVGKTVYLAYDNEEPKRGENLSAGERAITRNGNKLARANIAVKVIDIPRPEGATKADLDSHILRTRTAKRANSATDERNAA